MKNTYRAFPLLLFGGLVLVMMIGPPLWPVDPYEMDFTAFLVGPSLIHPMGTDSTGRDVLARFLAGGRLSLAAGTAVMIGGLVSGVILGVAAGWARGATDQIIMRAMDSIAAFPPILLAMAISIGLGGGLAAAILGVAVSTVPFFARLMRNETRRILTQQFVEAARAMGARPAGITLEHILPHAASTMLVQAAAVFGYAILTLAGIGFIGLGAAVPTAEWGLMITDGLPYALTGQWWLTVFPGLGIFSAVLATNLIADDLVIILRRSENA